MSKQLLVTEPNHKTLPARIAAITSVEVLKFVGDTFSGTSGIPATKIPDNHEAIKTVFSAKAKELGVAETNWFEKSLAGLKTQAEQEKQGKNGAGTKSHDKRHGTQTDQPAHNVHDHG